MEGLKVIDDGFCPNCSIDLNCFINDDCTNVSIYDINFCPICGQKIEW